MPWVVIKKNKLQRVTLIRERHSFCTISSVNATLTSQLKHFYVWKNKRNRNFCQSDMFSILTMNTKRPSPTSSLKKLTERKDNAIRCLSFSWHFCMIRRMLFSTIIIVFNDYYLIFFKFFGLLQHKEGFIFKLKLKWRRNNCVPLAKDKFILNGSTGWYSKWPNHLPAVAVPDLQITGWAGRGVCGGYHPDPLR